MEPALGLDPRDERCFLPIHVYDTATSRPVAVLLRPGKTPSGSEIRGHLRRLVRRIRRHWPQTRITIRGDGHYGRPEVMAWCDENGVDFIFGLPGNAVLDRAVDDAADDIRTRRAIDQKLCVRGFAETSYRAKSWKRERRACARIEATTKGLDIRFVVTSIETGSAEHIYETLYCARGQAENLIKLHKTQLASDRTSCRSPRANQMRLILHTAAYWLILTIRDTIPQTHALATAEFTTIRLRLLKLGAHHRDRRPRQDRLCRRLPRGRPLPPNRHRADTLRTVNHGAAVAPSSNPNNLQHRPQTSPPRRETDATGVRAFDPSENSSPLPRPPS